MSTSDDPPLENFEGPLRLGEGVMSTVLVQPPWSHDASTIVEVRTGQRLTFGRGAPGLAMGVTLDHPGVSRFAGEIGSATAYWHLTNRSTTATYVVENAEGAGEYLKVGPRRADMPVPFEISTVVLPAGRQTISFHVFAPEQPSLLPDAADGEPAGTCTAATFALDTSAKYFLVLVALCEPRLRGSVLAPLPTVGQVADRLRALPGCAHLTPRAVDFHVDYLARTKLRLRMDGVGGSCGFAGRREATVTFALRFGLVDEAHLGLLPDRRPSAVAQAN
jgi:hypothetical protein